MSRDPQKLEVFVIADALAVTTYQVTKAMPVAERFGLQSQIRRAAVSVAANLVEGCAHPTQRGYVHFVSIALGSAAEAGYLIGLAIRLGMIDRAAGTRLVKGYDRVGRALQSLMRALTSVQSPKPKA